MKGGESFSLATVSSTPEGFVVAWSAPRVAVVRIYAGTDPDHIERHHEIASGGSEGRVEIRGLADLGRWYFELVPDHGESLVLAARSLGLRGAPNFRDVGGYRTHDGQWVKMALVYRSGDLSMLTDGDIARVNSLGIRTVFDLRSPGERRLSSHAALDGAEVVTTPMVAGEPRATVRRLLTDSAHAAATLGHGGAERLVAEALASLIGPMGNQGLGAIMSTLTDPARLPAVIQCGGGMHRTGWAVAVLLTMLGVPRETVVADYVAINRDRPADTVVRQLAQSQGVDADLIRPLMETSTGDMDTLFALVDERYGTFDRYVHHGLGLPSAEHCARLRATLLAAG